MILSLHQSPVSNYQVYNVIANVLLSFCENYYNIICHTDSPKLVSPLGGQVPLKGPRVGPPTAAKKPKAMSPPPAPPPAAAPPPPVMHEPMGGVPPPPPPAVGHG